MNRRSLITLVAGAAAWPLAARAQQPAKVWRIGYLSPAAGRNPVDEAFEEGLRQLGWAKDQNIKIEYRYTGGRQDAVARLVAEAVGLDLDALITWGPPLSIAAKRAMNNTPLIFLITFDPIDLGLVSNMARPGGNVTGITSLSSLDIFAKRLQLLKEIAPSLIRVGILVSSERTRSSQAKDTLASAAKTLNLHLDDIEVERPSDLADAVHGARQRGVQAVYAWPSGFTFSYAAQISAASNANALPSIHSFREGAVGGGLLAYAADLREEARRGAAYVDKILRGAPPGTLPVEQLSKYELLINAKTAKALGLEIPPTLLARADEVIE